MSGKWINNLMFLGVSLCRRGTPLSLSRSKKWGWTQGLGLPRGGQTVLYTGLLYQMVPHVKVLHERRERFRALEETFPLEPMLFLHSFVDLAGLLTRFSVPDSLYKLYLQPLRAIVHLLRSAGVEVGYLYERDIYPGTLAYELGFTKAFIHQANKVKKIFEEAGVRTIITVDPHTTYLLKKVYPEIFPQGFPFEVRHYLEVIAEKLSQLKGEGEIVLHEGCVFARKLGLSDLPEMVLSKVGYQVKRPRYTGLTTYCCGGPVEGLFPEKAQEVAKKRISQLEVECQFIATLCPICHLNFLKVAPENIFIQDVSLFLISNKGGAL